MVTPEIQAQLALLGGPAAITVDVADMFDWPIITDEDEQAVLEVLRARNMSGIDIAKQFEAEFAQWMGAKHGLTSPNGTASILEAMYAVGIGVGDEVIAPTLTYWASTMQAFNLGATVVFADVDPETFCIDPDDIEDRITDRTKAIIVVHFAGYPCDMDPIMALAEKYNLKVVEDVSHAQGSLYKGRMLGTIGDVGAMSLMTGKSFAIGEGGILITDDHQVYERAVMFGHYQRHNEPGLITDEFLRGIRGMPLGAFKNRLNQTCAAMGLVQLKYYPQRIAEIGKAMNYFWDLLEGTPGIRAHRLPKGSDSSKGGWYSPRGHYEPEKLGGLSVTRFCEAVRAEGCSHTRAGTYAPLHLHPVFNTVDIYGHGKPTRLAHSTKDITQPAGSLPVAESILPRTFEVPWFKHYRPAIIEVYANAFRKVVENYRDLLPGDQGNTQLETYNLSII